MGDGGMPASILPSYEVSEEDHLMIWHLSPWNQETRQGIGYNNTSTVYYSDEAND